MKNNFRILALIAFASCMFCLTACEKEEQKVDYNNVTDDDWKKKKSLVEAESSTMEYTTIQYSENK